jgi:hydroxyacylglutathione hydrolase
MFQRFYDEGLAQSSYLIACPRTRQTVVVDPRRDVDVYVTAARQQDLRLAWSIETHIHADFLSGSRELAKTGAATIAGPGAGLGFDHHEARDGELLQVGDVSLQFLHTPGHTPEHISVLVRMPDSPARVLTGDTLFVGAVGRPDLLGEELTRSLAADLYESLTRKVLTLADDVEIHPGHGAGSLCGAGIGHDPYSTIGQERRFNPMLQHRSKEAFVAAILADLPDTPPYFPRMKRMNRDGPPVLDLVGHVAAPRALSARAAADAIDRGALLLDLRSNEVYAAGHPSGAFNIGYGSKVGYWAGWVIPAEAHIVLLIDGGEREAAVVRRQLLRVGIDAVDGYVDGGFAAWAAAGLPVSRIERISARDLLGAMSTLTLLDVRTQKEWDNDHIPGALHMPVGDIGARIGELSRGRPVATLCEAGYRSSLASSLLERAGFSTVLNVSGGMTAVRALEPAS